MNETAHTHDTPAPARAGVFATTRWTRVLAARGETPEAKLALGELCAAYWTPVHRFLMREGRDGETARDLTQEFFARVLAGNAFAGADPARGRFRSFLLGAVKHFLADTRDRERAAKRGGGVAGVSISGDGNADSELQIADPAANVPDTYFDRQWAFAMMERAFAALATELESAGKGAQFAVLKPWLEGDRDVGSQADAGRALGMGEGAVKVAIHRLRKRFRELIRAEIAHTVPEATEAEAELRYLVEVLAAR